MTQASSAHSGSSRNNRGLTRRQLFGLSAAGVAGAMLVGPQQASAFGPAAHAASGEKAASGALDGFTTPATATSPRFRWWWPNGEVELEQIAREVQQAADNGFHGLEIANVHHSVAGDLLDVENFGWGGAHWVAAVETALEAGKRHNVEIDITLGPSWPAAIPGITPQSEAALVELAHGAVDLASGERFSGALPEPGIEAHPGVEGRTLVRLQAARVIERPERNGIMLEHASLVDLTERVVDESVEWTAPDDGYEWTMIAYWQRGLGQRAEAGPHTSPESYVIDHFSMAGAQALIDFWEENILTPRIDQLLRETGGTFFEDSLEVETDSTIWAREAQEEFRKRIGYSLTPFLAGILEIGEKYVYQFSDEKVSRIRDDYNQVLSDLYSDYHLVPLRDWSHSHGVQYRVQAYGLEQDSLDQAGIVDIPETESLGAKNLDDYRLLASGRDIGGRKILSSETAAYLGKSYAVTWNEVLNTIGETFVGGVNQTVLHGFSYKDAPGAEWPGFAAFTPYAGGTSVGYSEAWGPRMPSWGHIGSAAEYLARTQWVLQQGVPQYDVAYFRQKGWAQTGIGAPWGTSSGIPTGWTHGFLNGTSLFKERSVLDGGVFAPDGGAYRAFVVDHDRFRGNEATMSLDAARKLLELVQAGLPVVFLGDWSAPEAIGRQPDNIDIVVQQLVEHMLEFPNVRTAAANEEIGERLSELGIRPRVSHAASYLKHVHRVGSDIEYFYIANVRHNPPKEPAMSLDQDVRLTRTRPGDVPYVLDAWNGRVERLAVYTESGQDVTVRVRLEPGQSTIIAFAPDGWAGTASPTAVIASTSVLGASLGKRGEVYVHAEDAGALEVSLAGGRTAQVDVPAAPAPIEIRDWNVTVEDWKPGSGRLETVKERHALSLDGLVPWSQIAEVADASGIGTYDGQFHMGREWRKKSTGVILSLGEVNDTFSVWVNGTFVETRDLTDTTLDISDHVHGGRNTVKVEVATPLNNRMRTVNADVYGGMKKQDYGLLGPVVVSAYGRAKVA